MPGHKTHAVPLEKTRMDWFGFKVAHYSGTDDDGFISEAACPPNTQMLLCAQRDSKDMESAEFQEERSAGLLEGNLPDSFTDATPPACAESLITIKKQQQQSQRDGYSQQHHQHQRLLPVLGQACTGSSYSHAMGYGGK
ncbi:hypothetical protein EK904_004407 [Melospiza melodia maxima]|nr:hypothetical protein EK904_004407 [Melospiza melodia maxima]